MDRVILLLCFSVLIFHTYVDSEARTSAEKCNYYRTKMPSIPKVFDENKNDADPKEFPFMAWIHNGSKYFNGILISENFVLSTAEPLHDSSNLTVVLGDYELHKDSDDAQLQTFDVIEMIEHPDFNYDDRRSNIKLFKLNQSIKLDEYVRPACLPPYPYGFPISQQLIEIGWGTVSDDDNNYLHKVKLTHISNKNCIEIYEFERKTKYIRGIDEARVFCAGANKSDRTMCEGFSGSALINADRKTLNEVVGIASYGLDCRDGKPEVFVNVLAYIDWIESIVWPPTTTKPSRKTTLPLKYILMIVAGLATLVLICGLVICARSRSPTAMNVHMNVNQ